MSVDAIPQELRERPQWVVWRIEERDGKPTKVPYRADGGGRASSTDAATWASFAIAREAVDALKADGIGFVFSPDDPFVGVDLDDGLSEAERDLIMIALDSYSETSVSGAGLHVIMKARLNGHGRNRRGPFEVYDSGRYFVVTGQHIAGTPTTIEERQTELEEVLAQFLPTPKPATKFAREPSPVDLDDRDLLDKAFGARNGDDFRDLYQGRWEGRHQSQSEADLALCSLLAFWCGRDSERIDQLFRSSGLYREKWERDDYRNSTIEAAIEGLREVYSSSRPGRDAVGTRSAAPSVEKGESAIASPRPDVVGTRDGTRSYSTDCERFEIVFEDVTVFSNEDEEGAAPLVGDEENVLIAEDGDVMAYGDGGAGKTTLLVDLALHLGAGDDWLGIPVARPVNVGLIENEGPRPLFRKKLRRKLRGWTGSPLEGRVLQLTEPWGEVSLDDEWARAALAAQIVKLELEVVIIGPLSRSGMNEAGTLQQVRDYTELLKDVRRRAGRRVTFILVHHENRGGQVSGAWEGAVDTLFHVQAQGHGQTRLFIQKARWSPQHHKQKPQLVWAAGDAFEVVEEEERDDNTVADEILAFVREHGGCGWTRVDEAVPGKATRLRAIRDNLLSGGRLVNRGSEARMKLWHADDPAADEAEPLCVQTGCEASREAGSFYCVLHGGAA